MKRPLTLIVASTALTAAIGLPAWGAMSATITGSSRPFAGIADAGKDAQPLVLASDDDDDDREYRRSVRRGHDDDDDREFRRSSRYGHDDDDDDGDSGRNPAPAGSITPPQNGLFGNGTPPKVQVN